MKWLFFLSLILAAACGKKNLKIDGAYLLVAAQYGDSVISHEELNKSKTIKVFNNGYWMIATFFGSKKITVEKASGGRYTIKNNQYTETVDFTSWGDSSFDKTYNFIYTLKGHTYTQEGITNDGRYGTCMAREKYQKIRTRAKPKDFSMEGVWKLQESEWFSKKVVDPDCVMIKIYTFPRFAWGSYHYKGKNFIGVGGGTYQYDGKKLIEHLEYFSYYDNIPGYENIEVTTLSSGDIELVNLASAGKEIYKRIQ